MIAIRLATRRAACSLAVLVCASLSQVALAQSRQVTTPNTTTVDGTVTVTLNGQTFSNQGLVGIGRLDANVRDFAGETLGSFSAMALDLKSWRRNADGSYTGTLYTLPDRGPNDVGPFVGTTDYRNRIHISQLSFRPSVPATPLPQSTASQNQLTITPTGGFFLTDTTGANFTGKDALGGITTRNGVLYPLVQNGEGAGRISLDSEGLAFRPDGSFYVSDEYAANIYHFDSTGRQLGALNTVSAIIPRIGGVVNFTGAVAPVTGRRNNQGLEALAVTPDNTRLVTILQSATIQDTNGGNQQTRNNTRILVYDITANAIPGASPIAHYVLQLPVFNQNGSGAAPDRTAAQSEMLALNNNQFLVLARDGIGRGTTPTNSPTPVFKSILLVDTTGATNLAGTAFETGVTPIASNGNLVAGIVPVSQVELINILNVTQLNRYGMNLATRPSNATSLSEKWEALALAPVLEEGAPQDFFLFVGNDNDFQTNNGFINGQPYNAALTGAGGTGNNDSVILTYRLTLPTYVDPIALASIGATSPDALYGARMVTQGIAASAALPAIRYLNAQRGIGPDAAPRRSGFGFWADGEWSGQGAGASALTGLDAQVLGGTVGADYAIGEGHVGVFGGYRDFDGRLAFGAPLDGHAMMFGGYVGAAFANGLYAQASGAVITDFTFKEIGRASVYGQNATGRAEAEGYALSGEAGWMVPFGAVQAGPFAAVDFVDMDLDGYTESGASISNLVFPERSFRKATATIGGEIGATLGAIRPALRAGYSFEEERGDRSAVVRLNSAQHVMGTQTVALVDTERNTAFGEVRVGMGLGPLTAHVTAQGRWGRGEDDQRVAMGVAYAF